MEKEKSAFVLAREKAKRLTSNSAELDGMKLVAIPESSIDLEPTTSLGWLKKQVTPIPMTTAIVIISDPEVLKKIKDLDVTIFSVKSE